MQTKQDHAYQILKAKILDGSLLPGQRIVVTRFANEIGTSAIPVREALLRLDAEGLVDITPHVGAVVTHITGRMIVTTLETLAVVEGYATRLAAGHVSSVLEQLETYHLDMKAAAQHEDWATFSKLNRSFHFALYDVVDNDALIGTIKNLWEQLDSYLSAAAFFLIPDRAMGSVTEHGAIVSALADPSFPVDELERMAREHKFATASRLRPASVGADETVLPFAQVELAPTAGKA